MTPVIHFDQPVNHLLPGDACRRMAMRPSLFDLVTSFFFALFTMLATMVMILFVIWILGGNEPESGTTPPPNLLLSSGASAIGEQTEFEIPAAGEVTELATEDLASVLAGVEAVSEQIASAIGTQDTGGSGTGTDKSAGPEIGDVAGEGQRWELTFRASSRQDYGRQLDFHRIELGAFGGGLQGIDYVTNFDSGWVTRHRADASGEERLYFSWLRASPLAGYERQLLAEAGITLRGRQILKFIPPELEIRLAEIELEYARGHGISSLQGVAKTVFRSEPAGAQYRFVVVSQRYKRGWSSVVSGEPKN